MVTTMATKDNFSEVVKAEDGIVLIDFYAGWCGPCKMFAPVFEAASQKHPELTFAKVDTEVEIEIAAAFEITSIPTIAVIKNGALIFRQAGALTPGDLEKVIEAALKMEVSADGK